MIKNYRTMSSIAVSVLAVSILLFGCSGLSTPSTPKDTVKRYIQAMEDHDCYWIINYQKESIKVDPKLDGKSSDDELKQRCEEKMKAQPTIAELEKIIIDNEFATGDNASVQITIIRTDKTATTDTYRLKQFDGIWGIQ